MCGYIFKIWPNFTKFKISYLWLWVFVDLFYLYFRLEFQGMGEVASPKNLDAGNKANEILGFAGSGEELYDRFINPKFKVFSLILNNC